MNYRINKPKLANLSGTGLSVIAQWMESLGFLKREKQEGFKKLPMAPFWAMVRKEITDHIRNWRFIILFALIVLTCAGTLYAALSNTDKTFAASGADAFFFLN